MSTTHTQFSQNVYEFQMEVFELLLAKFEGKVVGSDECNLDSLKDEFFAGYNPGDKVLIVVGGVGKEKKEKKDKEKEKKEKKEKKPRALSGYTYFGQQNKVVFNKEMDTMEEKPNYVTFIGKKWKSLSDEEKNEWGDKAKSAFEESQKDKDKV